LRQIATDYSSLGDLRQLQLHEIEFFYEPLIDGLVDQQRQEIENRDKGK
jgi:hypothetical protein